MQVTVRKIPLEDMLGVLILMRDAGEEFINFECDMNPTQDFVHVLPYEGIDDSLKKLEIDMNVESEDQMKTIKRLLNGSDS